MTEALVRLAVDGGVARVTLNRPHKRNALSRELLGELRHAVRDVAGRAEVRVVVLDATGPAFCAGMDLAQMQETAALPHAKELWRSDAQEYRDILTGLFQLHVPTVAVVQGPAVAGGLGLVLACDLVLASDAASFALPEPKRGITAAVITPLLVYRAGVSGASYLLLSGESIDARCAHAMGFVHAVEPADRLTTAAEALVQSILAGAPGALAITKQQLMTCGGQNILAQLETAAAVSARARETLEAREGLQAFLEKREPNWIVPGERGASAP